MGKYIKKYTSISAGKEDDSILSPNLSLVYDNSNHKILCKSTRKDDKLFMEGTTLEDLHLSAMVKITYQSEHGQVPSDKQVRPGYSLTSEDLPTLTQEGYVFKGWSKQVGDTINEDTIIIATWKQSVVISYSSEYGDVPSSKTVEQGYALTSADLPVLSHQGLTFGGWDKEVGFIVNSNLTLTASWKVTLSYVSSHGVKPSDKLVNLGYALTSEDLPVLSESGYVFKGWDKEVGFVASSNTTITASWKVVISYSSEHGVAPSSKEVDPGYVLVPEDLPELSESGWRFISWNKSAGDVISLNTTITASWVKQVSILYSTAHGVTPQSKVVDLGYTLTAEDLPTLSESGWVFKGWSKSIGDTISGDTVITASWKEIVTISYSTEHGTAPESKDVEAGYKLVSADLPTLTDPNYVFVSWDKQVNDEINADTVITATWAQKVTITYSTEHGTAPADKSVAVGYALVAADLPELSEEGWVFDGWDKEIGDIINTNTTITATWHVRPAGPANNEIWYTSKSGNVVNPAKTGTSIFGANITNNSYSEGKGVITFDGNITLVGTGAFQAISDLNTITLPSCCVSIGEKAFYQSGITVLPNLNYITSLLGTAVFRECKSLTSITVPGNIHVIPENCFYDCTNVTSLTIEEGVSTLGKYSLKNVNIAQLVLPSTISQLNDYSIYGSTKFTTIKCLATSVPTLNSNNKNSSITKIYVPASSVDSYKAATNWSYYSAKITSITD